MYYKLNITDLVRIEKLINNEVDLICLDKMLIETTEEHLKPHEMYLKITFIKDKKIKKL